MRLTAVSLFAGIGGFDLAFERAGVNVVAAVEIDRRARGVLADHFPETTLFTDVTEVTGDDLRAAGFVPGRGVIAAGWPCQGNSIAGTRGGLADPRSGLWRHVVRLLAETRAAWFIGENVPGLLSVNRGTDYGVVLGDLADLGMGLAWRILDAQHFGVPQRRRRVFVVGRTGADTRGPVEILFEPESSDRDSPPRESTRPGTARTSHKGTGDNRVFNWAHPRAGALKVTPTLDHTAGAPTANQGGSMVVSALTAYMAGATGPDDNSAQSGHLIAAPITAREQKGPDSTVNSGNVVIHDPGGEAARFVPIAIRGRAAGSALEVGAPGDPAFAIRTPGGGSSYPMAATPIDLRNALRADGRTGAGTAGTGVGESGAPAGTVGTEPSQAVVSSVAVRRLTPLECERLQGFPDGWTATSGGRPQNDAPRYRQAGNAVAVPVVEWIIKRFVYVASRATQIEDQRAPVIGIRSVHDSASGTSRVREETETEPLFDLSFAEGRAS